MADSGINLPLTVVVVLTSFLYLCLPVPSRCQQNVDYCNGTVCSNNGSCQEETAGFVCNCSEEFTGITCNTRVSKTMSSHLFIPLIFSLF